MYAKSIDKSKICLNGFIVGLKCIFLIVCGAGIGTLLLILAYSLPVNMTNKDIANTVLQWEGFYPRALVAGETGEEYFGSTLPDVLDNSSDMIMLETAMDMDKGGYWSGQCCLTANIAEIILITGMAM